MRTPARLRFANGCSQEGKRDVFNAQFAASPCGVDGRALSTWGMPGLGERVPLLGHPNLPAVDVPDAAH